MPHLPSLRWLALAAAVLGCSHAGAATIYKCFDRSLGVLYTDEPCKGEALDIRPGSADPVALAELQREREALSRSAAQRIADTRRPLETPVMTYVAPPESMPSPYFDYGYPAYWGGYVPNGYRGTDRSSGRREERTRRAGGRVNIRTVPATPSQLPHR